MKLPRISYRDLRFTLRNKKYLIFVIIFSIILGGAVIVIKKVQLGRIEKMEKQKLAEEMKKAEEEALLRPSAKPLSPSEVIKREEKIAGGKLEVPSVEKPEEEVKPEEEKITKEEIKIVDDDGLVNILRKLLVDGNPSLTYLTLREMIKRGIDPVRYLKQEIVDHPGDSKIRKNALIALFYIGGENVVPIFKASAKVDPDEKVREVALFCLDFLTGAETKEFFKDVMENDPSVEVRMKAKEYWGMREKSSEEMSQGVKVNPVQE